MNLYYSHDNNYIKSHLKTPQSEFKPQKALVSIKTLVTLFVILTIFIGMFLFIDVAYIQNKIINENGFALLSKTTDNNSTENLNIIHTWIRWKIQPGESFFVQVLDSPEVTQPRLDAINDVIFSNEIINFNGHTYYKGWYTALKDSSGITESPVPLNRHIIVSKIDHGHITIRLTNLKSIEGYSGFTAFQIDNTNNQLMKAEITIYAVNKLSTEELKAILRHELGHAFGLAHSENIDDLMHPTIETNYPYISTCDAYGIIWMYNGNEKSSVSCEQANI